MVDERVKETVELKHSMLTYLSISGTPTPDLGSVSMKLIDCVDDALSGRDPTEELNKLAMIVARAAAMAVVRRLEMLDGDHPKIILCRGKLMQDTNQHDENADPITVKYLYLRAIASAFRNMAIVTNFSYPAITDVEGNEL